MQAPHFSSLCQEHRWTWSNNGRRALSNVSMDGYAGGKLYVPPSEYDQFLAAVARSLERGEPLYLIERRSTPRCRWHADLDMHAEHELDEAAVAAVAHLLQQTLAEVLGEAAHSCWLVVLRAPSASRNSGGYKTGIHLIAPMLRVDSEQCLAVREAALARLEGLSAVTLTNPWAHAFDESVYKGSGLRMLGSRKMETCAACSDAEAAASCTVCCGTRRVDGGRPYAVADVLDGAGARDQPRLDALQRNIGAALRLVSTRLHEVVAGPTAPPPVRLTRPSPRPCDTAADRPHPRGGGDPLSLTIERTLVKRFGAGFRGLHVGPPVRLFSGVVTIPVLSPRFCLSVGREHRSSRVYLVLLPTGELVQKCHCPKGSCAGFRSATVVAPPELMRACGMTLPFRLGANAPPLRII